MWRAGGLRRPLLLLSCRKGREVEAEALKLGKEPWRGIYETQGHPLPPSPRHPSLEFPALGAAGNVLAAAGLTFRDLETRDCGISPLWGSSSLSP